MTDSSFAPLAFERIIEALNKRRVKYLVIGGVAALLQGVALPRTLDLDITPARDVENKRRLARDLRDVEARLRVPGTDESFEIDVGIEAFAQGNAVAPDLMHGTPTRGRKEPLPD